MFSHMEANWNCQLQISAFSLVPVFRIPFSLSDVIPNASFFNDFQNFLTFPLLFELGSEGSFSNVKYWKRVSNRHLTLLSERVP